MRFENAIKKHFDRVLTEKDFVKKTYAAVNRQGFHAENTIACAGVCRDEISQSLVETIKNVWGPTFALSSLAGMLFLGKTGFTAAEHHAPNTEGKERYVFYALPHIAIDADGSIGTCERAGRKGKSHACGALFGIQKELSAGELKVGLDFDDVEQSLVRMKILNAVKYGQVPDLLGITRITLGIIQEDLKRMIHFTVDTKRNDYAVFTGIQIHGPGANYIWPSQCYSVVSGRMKKITLK